MSAIPVRMLNELIYCERLYHLMHVQGLFEANADTVEGAAQHQRAERRRRPSDVGVEELWPQPVQSLHLGDAVLGIVGNLDTIRVDENGEWQPVEAKHASAPSGGRSFVIRTWTLSGDAWPNDQIQLCAQGLLLRANGLPCNSGQLYYRGNRKRVTIEFTQDLIEATLWCVARAHELENQPMPQPLVDSDKCFRCSLNAICLPDETNYVNDKVDDVRDIVPKRADLGVLYVSEPGTHLGKNGYELVVVAPEGTRSSIPLKDIAHIALFGNIQVSTQLLHYLMEKGVTVSFLTAGGRLVGQTHNLITKNTHVRRAQFVKFEDNDTCLLLARAVVRAKILNQRTLLRRNAKESTLSLLRDLGDLARATSTADSLATLRGIEGMAAKLYFSGFPSMLRSSMSLDGDIIMSGRNRRPPKDPVNAMLSFAYSLLVRDVSTAIAAVGLDPMFGFYHAAEPGRPALALDLMEPFRALIADSVVIRSLNTNEIQLHDFYIGADSCNLKTAARKRFLQAYERRMHDTVTHPIFGYKLSYRRMLELEARILSRYLMGDIALYSPIVTR
ncbi:CRISPR-associated protein, Cas1 family /CRISPR-associated exonuclease, Cas4 family [Alicyclobacillus hesperidum]|uniref:CRISPR-associated endonuclease Cas1 n=1 Tax=Alicyclobacillus hesperidum TaxID=89784 RepID=A0A1H2YFZ9_9BACL|nr:CRISPR-associated endonuclease Cas1 [Alicyclobacillus hesperidum]SDX03479.1 CRISPR-associated protein, Cas1 family /CRISPR-associated exonuclease, Cas4 family [Alicyclobacillus hesperidum]